jgi:hypothetical protein
MSRRESPEEKKPDLWDDRFDSLFVRALPIFGVAAYAVARAIEHGHLPLAGGSVSSSARDLLWFALIAGLASYATIETAKRVGRSRGRFQGWQTRRWMAGRGRDPHDRERAYEDLLRAWGVDEGEALRIFDLPTAQLAGQIGSAADVAVIDRDAYPTLIECLTGGRTEATTTQGTTDEERFQFAQRVRLGVDQLQIALADRWRRTVQGAAVWIAGLYGIGLAHAIERPADAEPRYVLAALLVGGPIAWLVHDLAALIEHARH